MSNECTVVKAAQIPAVDDNEEAAAKAEEGKA
jgi:hypothetical protein